MPDEERFRQLELEVERLHSVIGELVFSDRYVFQRNLQLLDGRNMQLAKSTGTKIGTETTQKVAFYGVTPVVQRSGSAQTAVVTTAATNVAPYGYATQAQADAIVALVNELRAALVAWGVIKGSA